MSIILDDILEEILDVVPGIDAQSECERILKKALIDYGYFDYSGYFLYNPNKEGSKWQEFQAILKFDSAIYKRESAISNSSDLDCVVCKSVTDEILKVLEPIYKGKNENTRIIVSFQKGKIILTIDK